MTCGLGLATIENCYLYDLSILQKIIDDMRVVSWNDNRVNLERDFREKKVIIGFRKEFGCVWNILYLCELFFLVLFVF